MRLVSAIYGGYHPFDDFGLFTDFTYTDDPADLQPGDVLVVWGGSDISPALYGKGRSSKGDGSKTPGQRDSIEWALMQAARAMGIPIIGVCRGGQMITALAGGHLIQHVNNHIGSHPVITNDNQSFSVNSIHHQMMVPPENGEYEIIAYTPTKLSNIYMDVDEEGNDELVDVNIEPEFIYYPGFKGFAIQWHPEGMQAKAPANQYLRTFIGDRL